MLIEKGLVPYVVSSEGSFNFKYLLKLLNIIHKENINVIHAHLFGASIYSSLAGMIMGVPVISTIHGASDISPNERFSSVKQLIIKKGSSCIVAVSNSLRIQLLNILGFDRDKIKVIYNGIDINKFDLPHSYRFKEAAGMKKDDILIGAIGNIRAPKAYDVLIDAAALLLDKGIVFKIIIVGQGEGELFNALLEQRERLGLNSIIEFIDFSDNVEEVLSNLDLFVLSSSSEGFSLATIEAMAAGVAVIATRSGGPEEIIENTVDGLLVEVNSPLALANTIISSVKDNNSRGMMRENARKKVQAMFSRDSMVKQYLALYKGLLRN